MCELLKIKQNLPYNLPAPVEPALEANEGAASYSKKQDKRATAVADLTPNVVRIPVGSVPPLQLSTAIQRKMQITGAQAKREFVRTIQLENENFVVQTRKEDAVMQRPPSAESSNGDKGAAFKARYEIPDDYITRTAAKIIGNRKELEMHEFLPSKRVQGNASTRPERNDAKTMPSINPSGERRTSPTDE